MGPGRHRAYNEVTMTGHSSASSFFAQHRIQCWIRRRIAMLTLSAMRIQRRYRERLLLRPHEQKARFRLKAERRQRLQMLKLHLLYTKLYDPQSGYYYYTNNRTGFTQWAKPTAFGDPDDPFDAPTPRTRRKIVWTRATGPG